MTPDTIHATPDTRHPSPKNIIVEKNGKTRRARKEELPWFKQRGWLPVSAPEGRASREPSASASAPTHSQTHTPTHS